MAGQLAGIRIVELAGIGSGPSCGRILAGTGADAARIDQTEAPGIKDPRLVFDIRCDAEDGGAHFYGV